MSVRVILCLVGPLCTSTYAAPSARRLCNQLLTWENCSKIQFLPTLGNEDYIIHIRIVEDQLSFIHIRNNV